MLSVVSGNSPGARGALVDQVLHAAPDAWVLAVSLDPGPEGYPVVQRLLRGADGRMRDAASRGATGAPAVIVREDLLAIGRAAHRPQAVVLALPETLDTLPFLLELWRERTGTGSLGTHYVAGPVLAGIDPGSFMADIRCVHRAVRRWNGWTASAPVTRAEAAAVQTEVADTVVVHSSSREEGQLAVGVASLIRHLNGRAPLVTHDGAEPARLPSAALRQVAYDPEEVWRARLDPVTVPRLSRGSSHGVGSVLWRARRPVHPGRLAEALSVALLGVVRGHGHLWLANRPESVVTWRSAGAHLELREAGPWLEAEAPQLWAAVSAQRRTAASWFWDDYFGERRNEITFTGIELDALRIRGALDAALLTDAELALGLDHWLGAEDPFFADNDAL
ncbi:GTP-binding protein [Streptomyces oryzae]|uniref:GTP-binding protein n=1 Tax=Streptomyces oryzae TaxID=1434886 RepID=A0ABS3X7Y0_9ACTN|nr:GTP-binding protein [Streptomyces oryzae]